MSLHCETATKTLVMASNDATTTECISQIMLDFNIASVCLRQASQVILKLLDANLDLIILDNELSEISGIEMIPIIMKLKPRMPIIVISADDSFETGQLLAQYGIWLHLLKPIETDKLRYFLNYLQMNN